MEEPDHQAVQATIFGRASSIKDEPGAMAPAEVYSFPDVEAFARSFDASQRIVSLAIRPAGFATRRFCPGRISVHGRYVAGSRTG
ncbi:hypothetical protein KCP69_18670 [Salmonella enterica subsp. enterica]|nr:hypothetical protein KCP69_18670 [Salmonella enterica subsp. enterica]